MKGSPKHVAFVPFQHGWVQRLDLLLWSLLLWRIWLSVVLLERSKKSFDLQPLELILLLAKLHLGVSVPGNVVIVVVVCILADNICRSESRIHLVRKVQWEWCKVIAWERIVSRYIRRDVGSTLLLFLWRVSENRTLAATSLLALLGCHGEAPCLLSSDKSWVAVGTGCVALLSCGIFSDESIKVELTLERLVLGLLKVGWDDFFHETFQIVDFEGLAIVDP